MMGAMLISSLVIFPALTAMRLFKSFRGVILCAAVTSVVCFCVGLTISFGFSTPVGATVVTADLTVFLNRKLIRRGEAAVSPRRLFPAKNLRKNTVSFSVSHIDFPGRRA